MTHSKLGAAGIAAVIALAAAGASFAQSPPPGGPPPGGMRMNIIQRVIDREELRILEEEVAELDIVPEKKSKKKSKKS